MSIVRDNLMNERGYSPYCGNAGCFTAPRTSWDGKQFRCPQCGWRSQFEDEFIKQYRKKWGLS